MGRAFWKAALKRALHTIAQTAVGMIGATLMIEQVNWLSVISASALAGVVSLLKSIAFGLPEVNTGRITVRAYERYDEDGRPIVEDGEDN